MNRREILNELAQIVAITDGKNISATVAYCPEAAQRAKGLIQVVESWPIAFPPAPFLSDRCANRLHGGCVNGACKCACHCPPEAPQQPKNTRWSLNNPPYPPEAPQQSAEPAPAPERHIDTPDELLELLAGISSDPQIEGMSLAQKTSSMALLHIAKTLQQIAGDVRCLTLRKIRDWDTPRCPVPR